ncbi:MAG: Glycogen synthase [Microgenomates bacterium OLB22]|nr:MAG: Glycogen synthase [Microgenomates bacterium OLB22]
MIIVLDPTQHNAVGTMRGEGRFVALLKEHLSKETANFVGDLKSIPFGSTLLIPTWDPLAPPILTKRSCKRQILVIFDVIPLKYPQHFPVGLRGKLNLWRNKRALSEIDTIITISNTAKSDIMDILGVAEHKIEVLPLTVFAQATSTPLTLPFSGDFLLYVGDVNWNKNLPNLANALLKTRTSTVFAGKPFENECRERTLHGPIHPWEQDYKEFLQLLQGQDFIHFAGYVSNEELLWLYENALGNMLVSRDEGFGLSYLEAASHGCPSVLSDIPVFREIAGDTGALFADPDRPEDIAHAIRELSDSSIRKNVIQEAQKRAALYSPEAFALRLEEIVSK